MVQHQQSPFLDLVGMDAIDIGRFALGVGDEKAILVDVRLLDIAAGKRHRQEDAIELAAVERFAGSLTGFFAQIEFEVGPARAQQGQEARQGPPPGRVGPGS